MRREEGGGEGGGFSEDVSRGGSEVEGGEGREEIGGDGETL